MHEALRTYQGVVWDWGDTLMRGLPGQEGPMVEWPRVEAMPGADEVLKRLSLVPVQCVATNAADSDGLAVAAALERVGLRSYRTHFLTSSEFGVIKPDPAFFAEWRGDSDYRRLLCWLSAMTTRQTSSLRRLPG